MRSHRTPFRTVVPNPAPVEIDHMAACPSPSATFPDVVAEGARPACSCPGSVPAPPPSANVPSVERSPKLFMRRGHPPKRRPWSNAFLFVAGEGCWHATGKQQTSWKRRGMEMAANVLQTQVFHKKGSKERRFHNVFFVDGFEEGFEKGLEGSSPPPGLYKTAKTRKVRHGTMTILQGGDQAYRNTDRHGQLS